MGRPFIGIAGNIGVGKTTFTTKISKIFKLNPYYESVVDNGVIQDRTIYEDVEIFAKNLYEMNHLSKRDWKNYKDLFHLMTQFIDAPDIIIYLRASIDTLLTRIKHRDRNFEKDIDTEYLYKLNISYERWIKSLSNDDVMIIDTDDFNIFEDYDQMEKIVNNISKRFSKYNIEINEKYIRCD